VRQADSLRYFDIFLESFEKNNPDSVCAFGWHVHWGYWASPCLADGSTADFAAAAEAMSVHITRMAGIADGMAVLDAGCGFGGTLATINHRWRGMRLTGVNIDSRQIERARQQVAAASDNQLEFIECDALAIPAPDATYDAVLSVESICHFARRDRFFTEARRILKPGGRLVVVDFVPAGILKPWIVVNEVIFGKVAQAIYGPMNQRFTLENYRRLASEAGFAVVEEMDATVNTLPSYPYTRSLMDRFGRSRIENFANNSINRSMEWLSRQGLLRYMLMTFRKDAR
jgi:ubiquinone/menaquinone biosynthesis C-methylase UbiE